MCSFLESGVESLGRRGNEETMDDEARLVVEQQEDWLSDLKEVLKVGEG